MNKNIGDTFLNIEIDRPIHWKFLLRHVLFSLLWIIGLAIVIFRIDLYLTKFLSDQMQWIIRIIPFVLIGIVFLVMVLSKWYYNVALIFYPLLVIFWFLPKMILTKGKIFLLSSYLGSIINTFKRFKIRIFQFGLFMLTLFLLLITNSNFIRIFSILVFSYFYYRYLFSYVRKSFNPPKLFGSAIEKSIDEIITSSEKGMFLVKAIDEQKHDEKLSEDDKQKIKLNEFIFLTFLLSFFKDHLRGFNVKKTFVISWIYKLVVFFLITLIFYTFVNFELFLIDNHNFMVIGNPSLFDFFYYTIKTITFDNINSINPLSVFAKISEILSFLTTGVFLFVFVTSVIFSLRQDGLIENMKKASELCIQQDKIIRIYIKDKYNADIQTIINESENIKSSLENMKNVIARLF